MPHLRTKLCEMLGIEHPILMGGLTGVGMPELAAAVSNAGGCGFVCAHNAGSPETCVEWLKQMPLLTDKPWEVNLTILREFADAEGYCNAIIEVSPLCSLSALSLLSLCSLLWRTHSHRQCRLTVAV